MTMSYFLWLALCIHLYANPEPDVRRVVGHVVLLAGLLFAHWFQLGTERLLRKQLDQDYKDVLDFIKLQRGE